MHPHASTCIQPHASSAHLGMTHVCVLAPCIKAALAGRCPEVLGSCDAGLMQVGGHMHPPPASKQGGRWNKLPYLNHAGHFLSEGTNYSIYSISTMRDISFLHTVHIMTAGMQPPFVSMTRLCTPKLGTCCAICPVSLIGLGFAQ